MDRLSFLAGRNFEAQGSHSESSTLCWLVESNWINMALFHFSKRECAERLRASQRGRGWGAGSLTLAGREQKCGCVKVKTIVDTWQRESRPSDYNPPWWILKDRVTPPLGCVRKGQLIPVSQKYEQCSPITPNDWRSLPGHSMCHMYIFMQMNMNILCA